MSVVKIERPNMWQNCLVSKQERVFLSHRHHPKEATGSQRSVARDMANERVMKLMCHIERVALTHEIGYPLYRNNIPYKVNLIILLLKIITWRCLNKYKDFGQVLKEYGWHFPPFHGHCKPRLGPLGCGFLTFHPLLQRMNASPVLLGVAY